MSSEIKKVLEASDPNRCQALIAGGANQCWNAAINGTKYCLVHGAAKAAIMQDRAEIYNIRSAMVRAKIEQMSGHPDLLSLHTEVGVLRMLLEDLLNRLTDDPLDMMVQSGPISEMVAKIEKLVVSCDKLERSRNEVVSRKELAEFAATISAIAAEFIGDPAKIGAFMARVVGALNKENQE